MAEWSPGALARMLGVSPTTLRTWDRRYGLGPSTREQGKHRRYTDVDADRLRRMVELTAQGLTPAAAAASALGQPVPERPRDGGGGQAVAVGSHAAEARGFARAAARLDAPRMRVLATDLIARHGVVPAWQQVFMPVLIELGRKVGESGAGIEVEHMASASVLHALRQVPDPPERGRLPALLACAPEELHTLPLDVLAAALAERGCPTRSLGARVPAQALLQAVDKLRPQLTVVWAHGAEQAEQVPLADLLDGYGMLVLVAGPGWQSVAVPEAVRTLDSLPQAVRVLLELTGRR
ncbi:MerR family transcriptional regulator [Kutzneria albida]|uniref:HTH merR-type domain-containing protein n=1 Tax=Kutzneria albida DSM 43870 TaxID=1449976 RepID=W5WB14_9PSEU|nr:MerR family transcriptional regulator [Kutzneria albida]AHH97955.1 hypothetical protein KALB_4593 [Kutzneria albida DSM 43870]